jgi:DNA primase
MHYKLLVVFSLHQFLFMIEQGTVDRILDAAQIVDVVSDFVSLKKRGVNYIGLCPFHNEKTPSFTVSPSKGICKCFGCGKGGNAVNFIMEMEQVNYYEALKYLAKKYHIEIVEKELTAQEIARQNDRESMLVLNDFAQKTFVTNLHEHIEGKSVGLAYFHERGFRDDIIRKFQLGYSLDQKDAFSKEALKNGYQKEFLIKTGLSIEGETPIDRFRGRVMFPVHTLSGKVVAFGGRILKKDDKTAKYLNSPESEIYHKSNELYGIFFAKQAIVKQDECFLVEGYTDVISMHQAGIENVVASSGTSLTPGQIRLIHRFTNNVTVIYDGDAAGIKASIRGIDLLLEEGMNIKVLLLPDGEDPDSFARQQNANDFIAYVEQHKTDFIRFKTNLLLEEAGKDPMKRTELIKDIVRSIAIIPDTIARSVYVKECSSLLKVDESLLHAEINKLKRAKIEKNYVADTPPAVSPLQQYEQARQLADTEAKGLYEEEELNILRCVVRYGEYPLVMAPQQEQGNEATAVTVIDFVCRELDLDGLQFHHPLYATMLDEARQHQTDKDFLAERFFTRHPNPDISRLAVDLATDKYTLSKVHFKKTKEGEEKDEKKLREEEERKEKEKKELLLDLVPRLIFEYKNKYILNAIKEKVLEIKQAAETHSEDINRLMDEMGELNHIKLELSKRLGERIIVRL